MTMMQPKPRPFELLLQSQMVEKKATTEQQLTSLKDKFHEMVCLHPGDQRLLLSKLSGGSNSARDLYALQHPKGVIKLACDNIKALHRAVDFDFFISP